MFYYGGIMNNSKIIIGRTIKRFRQKKGVTQLLLAEKVGVSEKQISKIETGIHYPKFENFVKILEALDITLKDFADDIQQDKTISQSKKNFMKITNKLSDSELDILTTIAKQIEKLKKI